jgi:hypothetical protein
VLVTIVGNNGNNKGKGGKSGNGKGGKGGKGSKGGKGKDKSGKGGKSKGKSGTRARESGSNAKATSTHNQLEAAVSLFTFIKQAVHADEQADADNQVLLAEKRAKQRGYDIK